MEKKVKETDRPATQEDIDAVQKQLEEMYGGKTMTLVSGTDPFGYPSGLVIY